VTDQRRRDGPAAVGQKRVEQHVDDDLIVIHTPSSALTVRTVADRWNRAFLSSRLR
jgi:hypothetical protein